MSLLFLLPFRISSTLCSDSYQSRRRRSLTPNCTHDSDSAATSPVIATRRQVLNFAALTLLSALSATTPAHAYSSRRTNEDPKLPPLLYEEQAKNVITTSTGLRYFDITQGSGETATIGDTVTVHYLSRLRGLNGIKLDSSFDHASSDGYIPPFVFVVGDKDVVPGLNEMVAGMKVGGKRRAVLEPKISYANEKMRPIPQDFFAKRRLLSVLNTNRDATIVFDIDLLKVKR
eukprot:Plantae.Rhodophyta-Hildenbrandia_rubra.ctg2994.p1 GENE.Plantae.Rhodophyta-Hildenbrandia_rubra.ctg2994~~Plantae.Rhodophyta-Hildenbrandia_rubra.ctg2994.p1  ORF type:complete len:231 (-),score=22.57 Plantae.Rhodophyta-Hildenbrandia_rubra.ctg2994:676-1368(-)